MHGGNVILQSPYEEGIEEARPKPDDPKDEPGDFPPTILPPDTGSRMPIKRETLRESYEKPIGPYVDEHGNIIFPDGNRRDPETGRIYPPARGPIERMYLLATHAG